MVTPIEQKDIGNTTLLILDRELNLERTLLLHDKLHELIRANRLNIILDLKNISQISAWVIIIFISTLRDLKERGGDLKFINLQIQVEKNFTALHTIHILDVLKSDDQLAAALEAAG